MLTILNTNRIAYIAALAGEPARTVGTRALIIAPGDAAVLHDWLGLRRWQEVAGA